MGIAFLLAATVLAWGVWRAEAKDTRAFLAVCLALNLVALVAAVALQGGAAFSLNENPWNACGDHCW